MICTVVMTILVSLPNGTTQKEQYGMDKANEAKIRAELPAKISDMKAAGIVTDVEILETKEYPPFDCDAGPGY